MVSPYLTVRQGGSADVSRRQANAIIALLAVLVLAFVVVPVFRTLVLHPVEGFIRDQQARSACASMLARPLPTPNPSSYGMLNLEPDWVDLNNCATMLGVTPPPVPTLAPTPPSALGSCFPYYCGPGATMPPLMNCAYGIYWDNMTGENACNPPPVLLPTPGTPALPRGFILFSFPPIPLPSVP